MADEQTVDMSWYDTGDGSWKAVPLVGNDYATLDAAARDAGGDLIGAYTSADGSSDWDCIYSEDDWNDFQASLTTGRTLIGYFADTLVDDGTEESDDADDESDEV